MKAVTIFKNHHEGKTTTVMGNWCDNGCQFFHKDEADSVFRDYDVCEDHQNDVRRSFSDSIPDYNELLTIKDEIDEEVFADFVLHLYTDPEIVQPYLHNSSVLAVKFLVNEANPDILKMLMQETSSDFYRCEVIKNSTDIEFLKKIAIYNDNQLVRDAARNRILFLEK